MTRELACSAWRTRAEAIADAMAAGLRKKAPGGYGLVPVDRGYGFRLGPRPRLATKRREFLFDETGLAAHIDSIILEIWNRLMPFGGWPPLPMTGASRSSGNW
jgi:hypothetical protein